MISSERSKQLLNQLRIKELTMDEFLMECTYWAIREGFDELKPRPLPTRPARVIELENKHTLKEKASIDWNQIYGDYPEVKAYYDQARYITNWNNMSKEWLQNMLLHIPEGDIPTREKIESRLALFTAEEDNVKTIKKTFGA